MGGVGDRCRTASSKAAAFSELPFDHLVFTGSTATGRKVMAAAAVTQWLVKVAYEALATPLTYLAVGSLKRREGLDTYDRGISFNPLAL